MPELEITGLFPPRNELDPNRIRGYAIFTLRKWRVSPLVFRLSPVPALDCRFDDDNATVSDGCGKILLDSSSMEKW